MKVDRRRVLQGTAAVLAAASLAKVVSGKAGVLTLVDMTLTESELSAVGASRSVDARAIEADLVRQWRDGLGAQVASAGAVTAYVRWDKALVLVGLARESRMTYRSVQLDRSVFAVRLSGSASGQLKTNKYVKRQMKLAFQSAA